MTETCGISPTCGRSSFSASLAGCQPLLAQPWERGAHPFLPWGCPIPKMTLLPGRKLLLRFS